MQSYTWAFKRYETFPPNVQLRSPVSKIIEHNVFASQDLFRPVFFSLASGTGSLPNELSPILKNEIDEELNVWYY